MSFIRKTYFSGILAFALLLAGVQLTAQCDVTGHVLSPPNNNNCGKVIYSYDTFGLLVPNDPTLLEGLNVGTEIQFSYEIDIQSGACTLGPTINVTCLDVLSLPPADCVADFTYSTGSYDFGPEVTFHPAAINSLLDYAWDFGDGTTGSGSLVSHVFPAQDFYEVCLTISGGNCGQVVSCQTVDLHECHAVFHYEAFDGEVNFSNLSTGNYTEWEWSMGDGNEIQNSVPAIYDYGEINIYTVCLTVWNDNGCSSKFCDYVFSGSGDICEFAACVYPGDTNADGAANVYDLLPIGVGYGSEGPPRQLDDVTFPIDWSAQYAPDWGVETINGQDFKHLDCNGDGEVDSDDVEAIEANYAAPTDMFMVQASGSPTFWLDFEWDTILIDDNTPTLIELEADLMAGTPNLPLENLTGFALQLQYPEEMVAPEGVQVDYNDNSFFGSSNNITWLHKDRPMDGGKFDLGFAQKNVGVNGFGKIATLNFIVISDLVARDGEAHFTVTLTDVVAVNPEGAMLTIGELAPAIVHVVDKTTATSTADQWLNNQVSVFPNPASNKISVHLNGLQAEALSVFNPLGQQVVEMTSMSNAFELNAASWERGIYLIKIKTDKGVANKRVVVQ